MLFLSSIIIVITNVIWVFQYVDLKVEYLGETSSLKIAIKEKEKEIERLKDKIQHIKNLNNDVEI